MYNFLHYLLEVATCQAIFCFLYLCIFRKLSFFQVNRFYLLAATLLSFLLPILSIPFWNTNEFAFNLTQNLQNSGSPIASIEVAKKVEALSQLEWFLLIITAIYFVGFLIHLIKLFRGVRKVLNLINTNKISIINEIKTVHIEHGPSFFAFLNYVFINSNKLDLSADEFQQVIRHEQSHIRQKHTLDNLFMELALAICWFNPFLRIMKKQLNNVHEFYADQQALGFKGDVTNYSNLILKLSSDKNDQKPYLSHQFSMINIKQRIIMLHKQKNPKKITLRYFALVPCLALLLVMFSFTKKAPVNTQDFTENEKSQIIGNISWKGNSLYSDSYLNEYFGLKTGEKFNEKVINQKLIYQTDGSDLASLFMDQGYLFFTVELKKAVNEKKIDLTFEITEGQVMRIGKVTVKGNKEIKTDEILKMIELKEGDLFSRAKLITSQRNIIASRHFDPEKVTLTPIPHPEDGIVDIEFEVAEY